MKKYRYSLKVRPKTLIGEVEAESSREAWKKVLERVEAYESSGHPVQSVEVSPSSSRNS